MMKKCVTACTLFLALALGLGQARASDYTLRVADMIPGSDILARFGTTYFMEEVTKRTDGRVEFQYYPSEQLGKAKDMLSLLQSGLADIALIVPSYISEKFPLAGVMDLPGGLSSSCEGTMAYADMLEDDGWLAKNEFSKHGVRKAFVYVNPPYELFLAGKREFDPLDLKGAKLRTVAGAMDLTVRSLKGVPVHMSAPEIRESLSRGTIDGIVFPTPTVVTYKLEGLIDSGTRGAMLASVATGYMISDAAWNRLPDDIRKIMREVGKETTKRVCEETDAQIEKSYQRFTDKEDVAIIDISKEQADALHPIFDKVRQNWAKGLDNRGLPGSEALGAFDEAIAKVRENAPASAGKAQKDAAVISSGFVKE